MKTLTEDEISHIFDFTKNRYVERYKVQVELVDHLANGIENQWKITPNKPLDVSKFKIEIKRKLNKRVKKGYLISVLFRPEVYYMF
ncbi:hypothetical protein [uncultured Algibacter sp.]|uniref:hypothetical protein n=1 Tax=uncultured Algibacter sp. TaxID=298659 RepID=UPI002625FDAC|nr:hypothetical protein [uncultured Algibacter sp.]